MPKKAQKQKKALDTEEMKHLVQGYIIPTLSLLILVLMLVFVVFPTIGNIQEYDAEISKKKTEVTDLEGFLTKVASLSGEESTVVSNNNIVDKYLPKQSRVASLIDNVNTLASTAGLETNELSGSETVRKDSQDLISEDEELVDEPRRVLVTFNYNGDFEEVYKLFGEISIYKELLSVESVIFSENRTNWSVEMTIASYNLEAETLDYVVENMMRVNRGKRILTVDEFMLEEIKGKV